MKVLHINCNYLGTKLHQNMISNLDKLDIINNVFVPMYTLDNTNFAVIPDDNVIVSKCFNKIDRWCFYLKQMKIIHSLNTMLDVSLYDCIHAYTLFTDGNCAYELSRKYGIPFIVTIRNTDVNIFFKKIFYLRNRGVKILLEAKAIIFLSETYKKTIFSKYIPKEYLDELSNKSFIIPNGIDDFWFDNKYEKKVTEIKDVLKVVFVGKINKNKNIITIQKALSLLRLKGINSKFTIVGPIEDKTLLKKIIKDSFTKFIDNQPKENLVSILRQNDIFVMTSYTETFGLVYAEALTQGLPLVYSKDQGFDNQFPEGIVGYHAIPNSPESISKAIENIINNYKNISFALPEKAERFKWSKIVLEYKSIYHSIINI